VDENAVEPISLVLGNLTRSADVEQRRVEEVLRSVVESSARTLKIARVNVWLFDEGHTLLRCVEDLDTREPVQATARETLAAKDFPQYFSAVEQLRNVTAIDPSHDARTAELGSYLTRHGITAMLDVPIVQSGHVVGVICHEHVGEPRKFETWERFFAGSIGDLVALIFETDRRVKAEREQRRLLEHAARMRGVESLGLLAAGVAHDFRNLLAVILGNAEVLEHEVPEGPLRIASRDVSRAALDASELCERLLTFSGRKPTTPQPVDLGELVEEMVRLTRARVPKPVALSAEVEPGLPRVLGDPTSLRQIILNLILNAFDAMPEKGGTVIVRLRHSRANDIPALDFRARAGSDVVLEVSDNGSGMSSETQSRLFEPSFTTKTDGHGFGLASVLGIVRGHEGAIHVESQVGAGTTFRIHLSTS
jgi:two-component system, cell cycle sensor histidine kinase and response regulator CckA